MEATIKDCLRVLWNKVNTGDLTPSEYDKAMNLFCEVFGSCYIGSLFCEMTKTGEL